MIGERRKTVFAKKQRRSFWVLFSEQAFISVDFDGIQNAFLADAEVFRQLPDLGVAVVDDLQEFIDGDQVMNDPRVQRYSFRRMSPGVAEGA